MLSDSSLKSKIVSNLESFGFVVTGEHAKAAEMAEAIAKAVIEEITQNGMVIVDKGSSAGQYKIK